MSFLFLLAGCSKKELKKYAIQGDGFGTTFTIQYYSGSELDITKGVDSVIKKVNRSVSTYLENSIIAQINRGDSTVVIDKIFLDNYVVSKEVNEISQGYFDPTIGVLRNAYGFGDTKPIENIDQHVLDSLMEFVGFDKIEVTDQKTVRKAHPEIYIDFNAVAKGYGIDCIGSYMDSLGLSDYLIELGGEILARGNHADTGQNWVIGIESYKSAMDDRAYAAKIFLNDMAMASSGNYRKFRVDSLTGKLYVHTINPLNGKAEKSDVSSASVLAPTCAYADAWATAFMAMGLERSKKVLEKLENIEAFLTYAGHDNNEAVFMTEGFRKFLVE